MKTLEQKLLYIYKKSEREPDPFFGSAPASW